jgi:hypothetical protein
MFTTLAEKIRALKNKKTNSELTKEVFDTPEGRSLLGIWLKSAGITSYVSSNEREALIRKDERQRFIHSIIKNMAMTEDELLEQAINQYQEKQKKLTGQDLEDMGLDSVISNEIV